MIFGLLSNTSNISFNFTEGNKKIVHNQNTETRIVTIVNTGLDTMTGGG